MFFARSAPILMILVLAAAGSGSVVAATSQVTCSNPVGKLNDQTVIQENGGKVTEVCTTGKNGKGEWKGLKADGKNLKDASTVQKQAQGVANSQALSGSQQGAPTKGAAASPTTQGARSTAGGSRCPTCNAAFGGSLQTSSGQASPSARTAGAGRSTWKSLEELGSPTMGDSSNSFPSQTSGGSYSVSYPSGATNFLGVVQVLTSIGSFVMSAQSSGGSAPASYAPPPAPIQAPASTFSHVETPGGYFDGQCTNGVCVINGQGGVVQPVNHGQFGVSAASGQYVTPPPGLTTRQADTWMGAYEAAYDTCENDSVACEVRARAVADRELRPRSIVSSVVDTVSAAWHGVTDGLGAAIEGTGTIPPSAVSEQAESPAYVLGAGIPAVFVPVSDLDFQEGSGGIALEEQIPNPSSAADELIGALQPLPVSTQQDGVPDIATPDQAGLSVGTDDVPMPGTLIPSLDIEIERDAPAFIASASEQATISSHKHRALIRLTALTDLPGGVNIITLEALSRPIPSLLGWDPALEF